MNGTGGGRIEYEVFVEWSKPKAQRNFSVVMLDGGEDDDDNGLNFDQVKCSLL